MSTAPVAPLRVGVIGLGRRGRFHLERWSDGVVAAVGWDPDPAARSLAAGLGAAVVGTAEELFSAGLDAVLLAVPTAARPGFVRLAAAAGAHVLLDPPVAGDLAAARSAFEAMGRSGRRIVVRPRWRDAPDFRAAAAVAASGGIGEPRLFRFERWTDLVGGAVERLGPDGPNVPRAAVYVLDQLTALADAAPESAYALPLGDGGLTATVAFAGGRRGLVTLHGAASVRLESGWGIDGDAGGYAAGRRWVRTAEGERYDLSAEPPATPSMTPAPPTPEGELRRVLAGGEPTVSARESLRLVALLEAVGRSLASGTVETVAAT